MSGGCPDGYGGDQGQGQGQGKETCFDVELIWLCTKDADISPWAYCCLLPCGAA